MFSLYLRLAPWLLDIIELVLVLSACGLVLWKTRNGPPQDSQGFQKIQRQFARLAQHKTLAIITPGIFVLLLRISLIPVIGVPEPRFHDEFSYLLAADTFAHGRVTNPTHPMWQHFESFHIIERPTYMSIYAPGEGLILAAGEVLGHPWIGQLLLTSLLCSVLCWALQAWLPPGWALFGGMLGALRIGLLSYWMNAYWSAALPALAATLLMGALPRIKKDGRPRDALLMGLGVVILANTRPYEGLVFAIPFAIAMLAWLFAATTKNSQRLAVILPLLMVIALGTLATGYYYRRVTGNPFELTYKINRKDYGIAPIFIWQTPQAEPQYRHPVMRENYRAEGIEFQKYRTLSGFLYKNASKYFTAWEFYLAPLFSLPLLFLPWVLRNRRFRFPLAVGLLLAASISLETWGLAHYFSPGLAIWYLVVLEGMRHLWVWRRRRRVGVAMVRVIPLVAAVIILLRLATAVSGIYIEETWPHGNLLRAGIVKQLRALPGRDLVIVRYSLPHYTIFDWVYNDADIDHSEIVWARDMGEQNKEILDYFPDRRAWTVDVLDGDTSAKLLPLDRTAMGTAGNSAAEISPAR
jgi:hypothetical protein